MNVPLMMAGLRLIDKCVTAYVDMSKPGEAAAPAAIAEHQSAACRTVTWYAVPDDRLGEFFRFAQQPCKATRWFSILSQPENAGAHHLLPALRSEFAQMTRHYPGTTIYVCVGD